MRTPPPKPPVKPEPPVKPVETAKTVSLDGLTAAVDLPLPGKGGTDAVALGKLDLDPKLALDLQLLGGDTVAKGNPKFELQKDGDAATPGWSVQMAEKNKDAVTIARVWQEQNEWKIQWAAEAKNKATLLRYCDLQFSCEKKTHLVALSTPKTVPPLLIAIAAGDTRTKLSRDFPLPDQGVLRLQILPLDKAMPKHEIKVLEAKPHAVRSPRAKAVEPVSGNTVSAKGHVFIVLTKEKTPRVMYEIEFKANGKDVQIDMQASCDIPFPNKAFNLANLQAAAATVGRWLTINDSDKNPNKKNMQQQIDAGKATRDQLKALFELAGELNHKASIPFQVYAVLGETDDAASPKVAIFQSGEVEKPQAGGPKKSPQRQTAQGPCHARYR